LGNVFGTTDRSFQFDEVGLTPDDFNAFEKILGAVSAEQAIAAGAP
jgi:hypothetical protein